MHVDRLPALGLAVTGILLGSFWLRLAWIWQIASRSGAEPLVETMILLSLSGSCWVASAWFALRSLQRSRILFAFAAVVTLLIRACAWQIPPVFTDDLYRYRWEGRIQQTGINPYGLRPVDPGAKIHERPGDEKVPGRDFKAVYGPLLLAVERFTYAVAGEAIPGWRVPAALADIGVIGLLLWWLRRRGRCWTHALIYAWCPLTAFEFWSNGHHDAWLVLALTGALAASGGWSGALLGVATLTKWWPAMLVPLWRERCIRSGFAFLLPVLMGVGYYWTDARENAAFASGFVGGWRNHDLFFGALLAVFQDGYRAKYAAFAILFGFVLYLMSRAEDLEMKGLAATAALLMLSANIHPWYFTWLLPFLTFHPKPALLCWLALAPLLHESVIPWRQAGTWEGNTASRWLVHGPMLALLGAAALGITARMEQKDS